MKKTVLSTLLLLLALPWAPAADTPVGVRARTVYHADGTYTESTMDPVVREQREYTYDQHHVLIGKRVYLLNERGQTVQGNVYDGRDVLKARASFLFDDFGRMIEERMSNLQGEVYQSILFTYDAQGNPLPPKSRTYSVQSPDMRPQAIDFTKQGSAPRQMDRGDAAPATHGNVPRLPDDLNPPRGIVPPPATKPADAGDTGKKRSIWQRMFKKGEDKDKKDEKK